MANRVRRQAPSEIVMGTDFGGLENPRVALRNVGYNIRHAFTSECNPSCIKLSNGLYPDIEKRYKDIASRDNSRAPKVDLYCAGVPCRSWAARGSHGGMGHSGGQLWVPALAYAVQCNPKVAVFECAPTLTTWAKFRLFRYRFVSVLETNGYLVETRLVDTIEHGWPQHRARTYIVAILKASRRVKFSWPEPLPGVVPPRHILVGKPVSNPIHMLPLRDPDRGLVLNELKNVASKGATVPAGSRIIVELGCTQKFSTHQTNKFPTNTATRAASCDWWIADLGRRASLKELMHLQGINPAEFDYE